MSPISTVPGSFEALDTDPFIAVITGTHSSGKSTITSQLADQPLDTLGISHPEYDDFRYGIHASRETGKKLLVVTVPEAARREAMIRNDLSILAENWTPETQTRIEIEAVFRIHAATSMAKLALKELVNQDLIDPSVDHTRPAVVSDRASLDGLVYSASILHENDIVYPSRVTRKWFHSKWTQTFPDHVFIADHSEVLMQQDTARLDDLEFRDRIAADIGTIYRQVVGSDKVQILIGEPAQRVDTLLRTIEKNL